jgi:hypothetical protein
VSGKPARVETEAPARKPPPGCEGLWHAYVMLDATRLEGLNGPGRITYQEIEAFSRLTGMGLEPWEVAGIMALERVYAEVMAEGGK